MSVSRALDQQVRDRAAGRCEYCRMHQSIQGATFHIEHVIPRSIGGADDLNNLVLACPSCNLHKSNRVGASDPKTGEVVPLFHPLADEWSDHFEFEGLVAIGKTAIGRATLEALKLNLQRRQQIREAESVFDLFPPD